jgi:hypothetical protein
MAGFAQISLNPGRGDCGGRCLDAGQEAAGQFAASFAKTGFSLAPDKNFAARGDMTHLVDRGF